MSDLDQPAGPVAAQRVRVVVEVVGRECLTDGSARVVVSAAAQLFEASDPVDVVLCVAGVDEPDEALAQVVLTWCLEAVERPAQLPELVLLGAAEAASEPAQVHVEAGRSAAADARSVALLTAAAQSLWAEQTAVAPEPLAAPAPSAALERAKARADREHAALLVARRDVRAALRLHHGARRPRVVGLFQHVSYWATVEPVWRLLAERADVELVPVALVSSVDVRSGATADFLRGQGYEPRPASWLAEHLDDVDVVLLDNPYDEARPWQFHAEYLARHGVRLAYLPYGNNAIDGDVMTSMLWDRPLHRLAWRAYLPSPLQRELYARHCAAGDDPVRVVGSPKHDVARAAEPTAGSRRLRELAGHRHLVVWNPHFRTAPGGWSTFTRYVRPLLQHAAGRDDLLLVVRPHFRLFSELRAAGLSHLERELRAAALAGDVVLDESADYRDAMAAADSMLSDLSSLATEFLLTGRPLLYLHRTDGPGPSAEGGYLHETDVATEWSQVEAWLREVPTRASDPAARRELLDRWFPMADGRAAQRVVDDLAGSLRGELLLDDDDLAPTGAEVLTSPPSLAPRELVVALGPDVTSLVLVGRDAHIDCAATGPTRVPLTVEGRALPRGSYRLRAETADGVVPVLRGEVVLPEPAHDDLQHVALVADDEGVLSLVVRPPVAPSAQQQAAAGRDARRAPLDDAVLLTSFHGVGAGGNPAAIARELERVGHSARRYWVVADRSGQVPAGCEPVLLDSLRHHELLARARWVVDDDATPAHLERRAGQTVLQTWHGTPLKKLRLDLHAIAPRSEATLRDIAHQARQWTHAVSPNPFTSKILRRAFGFEGELLETGYPRNDVLADVARRTETSAATRAALGVRADQPVVLYAPTWRDDALVGGVAGSHYAAQPTLDHPGLRRALGDDVVLWVRSHRFVSASAGAGHGVRDVSAHPDMADLLAAADVLVTDYSSSFFDYAVTRRPMVFFAHDLDHYRGRLRGHYLQMEDVVPGPVLRRAVEVTEALATLPRSAAPYADRYDDFVRTFAPWDDGKAAQRVVEAIF
ncbi:CDP-glycerol glycerophosphotransferase family protein [Angustibacter aerolatus]